MAGYNYVSPMAYGAIGLAGCRCNGGLSGLGEEPMTLIEDAPASVRAGLEESSFWDSFSSGLSDLGEGLSQAAPGAIVLYQGFTSQRAGTPAPVYLSQAQAAPAKSNNTMLWVAGGLAAVVAGVLLLK